MTDLANSFVGKARRSVWWATSRSDPRWLPHYRRLIIALALYGLSVFVLLDGPFEVWFEAAFFAAAFPAAIWPLLLRA